MIRTHEERASAIAKAELKWIRSNGPADVVQASVHGDRVFLFGLRKRVLAAYCVRWGKYRVDVWLDSEWDLTRRPEDSGLVPVKLPV
jgi:hypothetical protein